MPNPDFWTVAPSALSAHAGANRATWNLRADSLASFTQRFDINANSGLTPASPEGALVPPGVHTLTWHVDGHAYTQRVTVRRDPRSPVTSLAIRAQYQLQQALTRGSHASFTIAQDVIALRAALSKTSSTTMAAIRAAPSLTLDTIIGTVRARGVPSFQEVNGAFVSQLMAQDYGDLSPTPALRAAYAASCLDLTHVVAKFDAVLDTALPSLNGRWRRTVLRPSRCPRGPRELGVPCRDGAGDLSAPHVQRLIDTVGGSALVTTSLRRHDSEA